MRRSARVAAATEVATSALSPLPLPLVYRIFLLLPVDERARACCVCRGWRAVLADPALWARLDLTEAGGVPWNRNFEAILRGGAAKARGHLVSIDIRGVNDRLPRGDLLEVVAANASSLRELRVNVDDSSFLWLGIIEGLLHAAPLVQSLEAGVTCSWTDVPHLFGAEPLYPKLRLSRLEVEFAERDGEGDDTVAFGGLDRVGPLAAALADATLQPTVQSVNIERADTSQVEVMDALADAVLLRQLRELAFNGCTTPAPVPLARVLSGGKLTCLALSGDFDFAGATLVGDALRHNKTLKTLSFYEATLSGNMAGAVTLLSALAGHSSLRELLVQEERPRPGDIAAFGAALAAIVAADAPELQFLSLEGCRLCDDGLTPVVAALPHNHHLRELDLWFTRPSDAFLRDTLLPAVRANASLRKLRLNTLQGVTACPAQEAMALVLSRTQHR